MPGWPIMRPPRSAPVPGLIVGLRLLRRRPLPLHIPTSSDLSGWRPPGPKVKGCPALRGGTSGANRLTGFPAVQSECASDTQLCGDWPPASASLGVACMEGEGGRRKFLRLRRENSTNFPRGREDNRVPASRAQTASPRRGRGSAPATFTPSARVPVTC